MATPTPGGDWRNPGGRSAPAAGASRRSWQGGRPAAANPNAPRRKSWALRVLLAGAGTGVLIALIVVIIWFLRPPRFPAVVIVAPDSPESLALDENAAGAASAAALVGWAQGGDRADRPRSAEVADRDGWGARLDATAGGWTGKPSPVVLYFTAHGGADRDGPFLWMVPPDARAPADAHKLPVRKILDRLAALPADQPKLLVFDATRVRASWPHGMIHNDFAHALKGLDAEIARVGGLAVICASDDDQRSWVSEEWRESVFGRYLREGMAGAGGTPGGRVSAAGLFKYAAEATARWALANRNERQTPILLPKDAGPERAERIELAVVPQGGFPAAAEPPSSDPAMPGDLAEAWGAAWDLATRGKGLPGPDTTDPLRWREYLDLLGRWERLARVGGNTAKVKERVGTLAGQLKAAYETAEPVCLAAALPAGRALGLKPADADAAAFATLWTPPKETTRADVWAKQAGRAGSDAARRVAATAQTIDKVQAEKPTAPVLAKADDLFQALDGSRLLPVEGHFLRMLHKHLDPQSPPAAALLAAAIDLRGRAEQTAWVGGANAADYPHAEQVFRWVRERVQAGDRERQLGQDLLFDSSAETQGGATAHFARAAALYNRARDEARVVMTALTLRDRALTRLPYYARWAAGYRGRVTPAEGEVESEVEAVLGHVETAGRGAHHLAALTADVPADGPARDERLKDIAAQARKTKDAVDAVEQAFNVEAGRLTNEVLPSNWHALDNALSVPFIPPGRRGELYRYLRHVSLQLATVSRQEGGASAPAPRGRELGKRQGRMAVAVLWGESPELEPLVLKPDPGTWRDAYRDAGGRIADRYRGLVEDARAAAGKADAVPLPDAAPHLARAAYLARLTDPAVPLPAANDPPAAERRHWRHYLLLWQAQRTIAEGWADVGDGSPDLWYCRKAADLMLTTAEDLIRGPDPARFERRLKDAAEERKRQPTVIALRAKKDLDVGDERDWRFAFDLTRAAGDAVGYPAFWVKPPGEPYALPDPGLPGRRVDTTLADKPTALVRSPELKFVPAPKAGEVPAPGKMLTTVLYRGHRTEQATNVWLAGAPTLDWNYHPPKGDAPTAFMALAEKGAVAGAVTVLIDGSGSMKDPLPGGGLTKIQATRDALRQVLRDLPEKTTLTVAYFWGSTTESFVTPLDGVSKLEWLGGDDQIETVIKAAGRNPEGNTPLARSVRAVLGKRKDEFWPKEASGVRTLVVLTDGDDNWDEGAAGRNIRTDLLGEKTDVEFHLIFFGLDAAAKKLAEDQYRVLKDADPFEQQKFTPPQLYWDVSEVKALTDKLRQAVLPRLKYVSQPVAGVVRQSGRLLFTPREKQQRTVSPPLPAGVYDLTGLRTLQHLHIDPGDRLVLRADGRRDTRYDLSLPAFAHELAEAGHFPHRTAGDRERGGVHLTLPALTRGRPETGSHDLMLVATLEPAGGSPALEQLQAPRPLWGWFDVEYADRKGPDDGLNPTLRVVNRRGPTALAAPTWDLTVSRWDKNRALEVARLPSVTGCWVDRLPPSVEKRRLDLRLLDPLPDDDTPVDRPRFVGFEIESLREGECADLPEGDYLTVRMKYPGRKVDRVFLRPDNLKGPERRALVHERHLYYDRPNVADRPGRYTARFGPISKADRDTVIELVVVPVAAVTALADQNRHLVTLPEPKVPGKDAWDRTDLLALPPGEK